MNELLLFTLRLCLINMIIYRIRAENIAYINFKKWYKRWIEFSRLWTYEMFIHYKRVILSQITRERSLLCIILRADTWRNRFQIQDPRNTRKPKYLHYMTYNLKFIAYIHAIIHNTDLLCLDTQPSKARASSSLFFAHNSFNVFLLIAY